MSSSPASDVLVRAEHVSKKFCRSLKRSLWYGVADVAAALNPFGGQRSAVSDSATPSALPQAGFDLPPLRTDEFWAVRDVSFELKRGECLGLIGHNGAGKSTLLKVLNSLIPPDTGRITMRGRVGALIELNAGFNPILSGRENIYNQAALLGFSKAETAAKFDAIVEFAEIGDFLDMPVQNYSSGMRVRLGFAVAVQMKPDVLIIDEVLAVGDVAFRFKCLNAIGELMKTAAVIFVTHTMPQVFRICSEVIVMDHGRVAFQGRQIAEGVSHYLALFSGSGQNISGSGEVKVRGLAVESTPHMLGSDGSVRIGYGASLTLRARLVSAGGLQAVRVQFLFWNAEMLPILDIMTAELAGFRVAVQPVGEIEVTAAIPRLELNSGKYSLSVIVISEDQAKVYCRHDNAAFIQVEAAAASGAHVLAAAEWSTATPGPNNPAGV
jgi:lipopolysaccharide transport system ATP-binding protein